MKLLNKTQSGRSMVEMLGVLAIIGVLSVGGIAGYSKAMFKYKVNQTLDILSHAFNRLVELDGLNTKGISVSGSEGMVKYGIMPDCDLNHESVVGEVCPLPLNAELGIDIYYDIEPGRQKIAGEIGLFIHDNHEETCTAILSSDLYKIYPDDWWNSISGDGQTPPGTITVEGNMFYTQYPFPESPEYNTITAKTIADACEACVPNMFGYCTIRFGIRS